MRRGEIRWVAEGGDSGPPGVGRYPVLVVQQDEFNDSLIPTVLCAAITSDTKLAHAPGNVFLSVKASGLDREAVANISRLETIERYRLSETVNRLGGRLMREVDDGLRLVLGC